MADAIVTVSEDRGLGVTKITWAWTSATGGAASGTTTGTYTGKVRRVITDPGATAPTDDYDITITDSDGYDVLDGNGANRDTATTEVLAPSGIIAGSTLTLNIANAGDEKVGTVVLYVTDDMS